MTWGKLYPLGRNLISVLALTSCFITLIMTIFRSAWPQLDITPCSYQSNLVIALILLYLSVPFFTAPSCFCLAYLLLAKLTASDIKPHAENKK